MVTGPKTEKTKPTWLASSECEVKRRLAGEGVVDPVRLSKRNAARACRSLKRSASRGQIQGAVMLKLACPSRLTGLRRLLGRKRGLNTPIPFGWSESRRC